MSGFLFQPSGGSSGGGGGGNLVVQSRTTTFTASTSDDLYFCSTAGGAYTATLPTASGNAGKVFEFIKTTNDFSIMIIANSSAVTIGKLAIIGESRTFVSNGVDWILKDKVDTTNFVQWTPTFVNAGTPTSVNTWWRKNGEYLDAMGSFIPSAVPAGVFTMTMPGGLLSSASYSAVSNDIVGLGGSAGSNTAFSYLVSQSSNLVGCAQVNAVVSLTKQNSSGFQAATSKTSLQFSVRIDGWDG